VTSNGVLLTSIDPNFKRPYTDEFAFGLDRELMANFKLSAVYTYRREKDIQATINPAAGVYATTLTSAVDPGVDGAVGTADDGTYGFYQRLSATNPAFITNDPTLVQSYKGLEITATKRLSNRWQMLAGYTLSKNRQTGYSADVSPNLLINNNGNITNAANADRPNQFQADRDVHPAVARRDLQRQLHGAAGTAGDARDQPLADVRRRPDHPARTARQHEAGYADEDRRPRRQAAPVRRRPQPGAHARSRQPEQLEHRVAGAHADAGDGVHRSDDGNPCDAAAIRVAGADSRTTDGPCCGRRFKF